MLLCFVYFLHVVVGTWFGMALVLTTECFSKRKGMEFSGFSVDFWEIENVVTHNNSGDLPRSCCQVGLFHTIVCAKVFICISLIGIHGTIISSFALNFI